MADFVARVAAAESLSEIDNSFALFERARWRRDTADKSLTGKTGKNSRGQAQAKHEAEPLATSPFPCVIFLA
jgi:hypothetical protein